MLLNTEAVLEFVMCAIVAFAAMHICFLFSSSPSQGRMSANEGLSSQKTVLRHNDGTQIRTWNQNKITQPLHQNSASESEINSVW